MVRLFLLLMLTSWPVTGLPQQSQQIKKDFVSAFSNGNTRLLDNYFHGFINMTLSGKKGFYPDIKAKWLLEDFFQKHKVSRFTLKESGYSGDNYYLIGIYDSGTTQWNVYFLFSPGEKKFQIQQMDIEQIKK